MSRIVIVGAGRVGLAFAKIYRHISDQSICFVDSSKDALNRALVQVQGDTQGYSNASALRSILTRDVPDIVVCATPFTINKTVAQYAADAGINYIDFTEDNAVTSFVRSVAPSNKTFVPQTGLAPGLITYLGLELFKGLGAPQSLSLRVGALPMVSTGPEHYKITWSTEGLINEYIQPVKRIRGGLVETAQPLADEETCIINGVTYEAFNTSGGVGSVEAYTDIPNVDYKTLRHPGHLQFMHKFLSQNGFSLEQWVAAANKSFLKTRDDVVVLSATAVDQSGMSASVGMHFYPHRELGLTALELTTAGTGVAVAELILAGKLPTGALLQSQIPMDLVQQTKAHDLVFSCAR